jgi:hypothetical protein
MTKKEILIFGEVQYLKGRLDELYKALPTITNVNRQRKIDQRIEKYLIKLNNVDKVAHYTYLVELSNRKRSKEKSKTEIKQLLSEILGKTIVDDEISIKIKKQIEKYD